MRFRTLCSSGGTGMFASPNGLILTNHHVALDCIRTSTLAEQQTGSADNLIHDRRTRTRVLNESLFQHRSAFARGLAEWRGNTMYPDLDRG